MTSDPKFRFSVGPRQIVYTRTPPLKQMILTWLGNLLRDSHTFVGDGKLGEVLLFGFLNFLFLSHSSGVQDW